MLAWKVRYTIGSRELINMFLKGLHTFPHIVKRVIDKSPTDYYNLKEKTIAVVKNQQLLWAIKNSVNPTPFHQPFQCYTNPRPPQYNSLNAPQNMNNVPVPMDLSKGHMPPNWGWPRQNPNQSRGNATQLEQNPQQNQAPCVKKCYNCNKPRHFARECHRPKQNRARQVYV